MDQEKRLRLIQLYINKMPSLPTSVTKIMEICNDPKTSPADLNRVISLDPVLMGKVMKLINSAYYGLSQEITSLVRAIIMLGINTVKNLALSTAVLGSLGKADNFQAINMDGFWRHSLCVGVTSKMIANKRRVDSKLLEEYFIAGLLHDIGKIPLNNRLPEDYVIAMSESDRNHSPLYEAEHTALGFNHSLVGNIIAKTWKLDAAVTDVITFHHYPDKYSGIHRDKVYTVALANYFANYFELGYSGDRYPEKLPAHIFQELSITMEYLEEIEEVVQNEIEKARIFLQLVSTN